jgi:hypothetical protein
VCVCVLGPCGWSLGRGSKRRGVRRPIKGHVGSTNNRTFSVIFYVPCHPSLGPIITLTLFHKQTIPNITLPTRKDLISRRNDPSPEKMPDENAKAQMQRFVSLVCRYPFFQLDEEEEEEEMEEYFRRRSMSPLFRPSIRLVSLSLVMFQRFLTVAVKWEVNVLSKRGGFDEVIFNRFFPTEKYANLEEGKDDAEGFRYYKPYLHIILL